MQTTIKFIINTKTWVTDNQRKNTIDRQMLVETVDQIINLLQPEAYQGNMAVHSRQQVEQAIKRNEAIIALTNAKKIVGFVYLLPWKNHVEIAGLVVHPNYRQQKIGAKLFRKAIALAKRQHPQKTIIFFANNISKNIGKKHGFSMAPKLLTHQEFAGLCQDCLKSYKKPNNCHCQVMILTK